jgi:hypothetical protein
MYDWMLEGKIVVDEMAWLKANHPDMALGLAEMVKMRVLESIKDGTPDKHYLSALRFASGEYLAGKRSA